MDWIFTIVPQELPEQLASRGEVTGQIGGEGRPLVPSRIDETPFPRETGRNHFDHVVLEPLEGTGPDEAHHPRSIGQRINWPADQHEGPGLVRAFCRDQSSGGQRRHGSLAHGNDIEFRSKLPHHGHDIADVVLQAEPSLMSWHIPGVQPIRDAHRVMSQQTDDKVHAGERESRRPTGRRPEFCGC